MNSIRDMLMQSQGQGSTPEPLLNQATAGAPMQTPMQTPPIPQPQQNVGVQGKKAPASPTQKLAKAIIEGAGQEYDESTRGGMKYILSKLSAYL